MKIVKKILAALIIMQCTSSFANPVPEMEKAVISEHKTYQDFKETFMFLIAKLTEESESGSEEKQVSDAHWTCVNQQQIVKMFNNNKKYKKQFDQEFAKEYLSFDATLDGFQKSVIEMKSFCDQIQAEYDKS
jgi:hypothetical protein